MEIRLSASSGSVLSFLTVSSVAPVEGRGPQHEWWCCSTTDYGLDMGQSSCVPLGSPAASAETCLSYQAFLRMWWKMSCASCSAKSRKISIMIMTMIIRAHQTTLEGCGPNHMKPYCVRPAEMAFVYRMNTMTLECDLRVLSLLTIYFHQRITKC